MRILTDAEFEEAKRYMEVAAKAARYSPCFRRRCGSDIVNDGLVLGIGYNAPPGKKILEKCLKDDLPKNFKSDKNCCIHAEQNAIKDALINHPDKIVGSRLYFTSIDEKNNILFSGKPYCTICSKESLNVGIAEFVLWHESGIAVYDTQEYNDLSFAYRED